LSDETSLAAQPYKHFSGW